jgi:hypothetical protein
VRSSSSAKIQRRGGLRGIAAPPVEADERQRHVLAPREARDREVQGLAHALRVGGREARERLLGPPRLACGGPGLDRRPRRLARAPLSFERERQLARQQQRVPPARALGACEPLHRCPVREVQVQARQFGERQRVMRRRGEQPREAPARLLVEALGPERARLRELALLRGRERRP